MLKKMFDPTRKVLKKGLKIAEQVIILREELLDISHEEILSKTAAFKEALANNKTTLEEIMVEAFAIASIAATRVTGMTPYKVQISGAYVINGGNIAEMKTGEGKTLTAVLPAYLNALTSKGVHIVTVNEYLAKREAEGEIGEIFRYLGLSVGLNLRDLTKEEKIVAYDCDIMYSTNSELGFDYLRDHMEIYAKNIANKRGLSFAIIDEVDSILIDEARTPLIISGGAKSDQNIYTVADTFVKRLNEEDYEIDIEAKTIHLSQAGITKAESTFKIDNLFDLKYVSLVHRINNSLRANYIMANDKEYVVRDGEILIVDQFTGRILSGRQFSEGLHQAIEAKEGVEIKKETVTVATITYQNFFRMYSKLSGMTGTAKTEEEEFLEIYNMFVVEIPTNKPVVRFDDVDLLFVTLDQKYAAIVEDIKTRHALGQPILVGTISVESSEYLSGILAREKIKHEVLNAKNNEREAEIVANAGLLGAVTIATNMAGRGTDIKLGEGVVELGGLAVIGSERHESRRIDNQLRGRSGRQGDPGYSKFYISAEDELLVRFTNEKFKNRVAFISRLNNGKPLQMKMFQRYVTSAQKKIEGRNYDSRKNVLKYDDVLRAQREIIYKQRNEVLVNSSVEDRIHELIDKAVENKVLSYIHQVGRDSFEIDDEGIIKAFNGDIYNPNTIDVNYLETLDEDAVVDYIKEFATNEVNYKKEYLANDVYNEFLKVVLLRCIDTHWMKHIDTMSNLRQGVGLQSYGQSNPLIIYQQEGYRLFTLMIENIAIDVTRYVVRSKVQQDEEIKRDEVIKNAKTNQGTEVTKKNKLKDLRKKRVSNKKHGRNAPWR